MLVEADEATRAHERHVEQLRHELRAVNGCVRCGCQCPVDRMGHRIDGIVGIGRVKVEGRVASRPGASSVCRRPQEPAVVVGRAAAPALAKDGGLEALRRSLKAVYLSPTPPL